MEVMKLNEDQLKTFLAVATFKSYSKAGCHLNVTQPTITSRIKALETNLQCKLFSRVGHEIHLTQESQLFIDYAKNILIYMQHAKQIKTIVKEPIIKVGFSPGYSMSFIVKLLKTIKEAGGIDIHIKEGYDSVNLNERAINGELDLIFSRVVLPASQNFVSEYLFENNLVVALPKNHPLCTKKNLLLTDLEGETIISYRRGSTLWQLIDQQLLGVQGLTRIDVDNNEMLVQAVRNGIGIGITPRLGVDYSYKGDIVTKSIEEINRIPNRVYVQYRKNLHIDKIAKKIIYSIISHRYANSLCEPDNQHVDNQYS